MSYTPHPAQVTTNPDDMIWPVTPLLLDIQAAQSVYGANMNTRAGDDIYFAPGGEFAMDDGGSLIAAIWDAGGNDTFSAENQTADVTIDLRPGHFSSIGAISNNIAIAEEVSGTGAMSAWIENAVGGSGNDTLQGNILANALEGNAGDDVISGDGGRDFITGGRGNDTISGGTGNDDIFGNENNDVLSGDDGDDRLWGGFGNDTVHGDAGNDLLVGNVGDDNLWGDDGEDVVIAGRGNDVLDGGADHRRFRQ